MAWGQTPLASPRPAWWLKSRGVPSRRQFSRRQSLIVLPALIFLCLTHHRVGAGFVSFRRFVPAWSMHAEADESRSTVGTPPPTEWAKARSMTPQPGEEPPSQKKARESPWQLAQTALQQLLLSSEAETKDANMTSKSRDLAAAGAMFTLAASIASEAPLFKMAAVTEETAVRLLSGLPLAAFEDVLPAAALTSMQEAFPAIIATSLLVAAMGAANGQLPNEATDNAAEWLQELNATAQKIWESGTGNLNTQATTLLREVGKLWTAAEGQLSVEEVQAAEAAIPVAGTSHGIALRCGSARKQGKDWILPLEAQLFRRNEGRHAMLLGLCRQLLFRTLDDISEGDFDERATERYEERARLIFRSLQLPLLNDRTLQRLEVRVGGSRDDSGGWQRLPPTNAHGVVEANVRFADDDIELVDRLQGQVQVEVRLAGATDAAETASTSPAQRPSAPPVQAVAELVSPEGVGVISDIDDTVKVTEVFYGIKAVLQNTFLKSFDAVPGMAKMYQGWAKHGASFHYVSKSPPELHGPLSDFLTRKGFPVSSIHLCPLLGRDRANFKMRQVTSLLSQFPKRKFILVGDSGERDPEVYAEILRRHPSQVLKVMIRAVVADDVENLARATAAFKGIDEAKWQVFTNPDDILEPEYPPMIGLPAWLQWPELPNMGDVQAGQTDWPAVAAPLQGVAMK
mmetsp:Transcript_25934/g.48696  ORF Transcript_25934/g.48696 Transcript_25934/m.48696 type:complete len:685 (-) Transcript_25934:166-2220(-)